MKTSLLRGMMVVVAGLMLAGCGGDRASQEALAKSGNLVAQKNYPDANNTLVDALQARENVLTGPSGPTDQAGKDAMTKTVQSDAEILKLERAQIPIYLHMEKADLASVVYADVLKGAPDDPVLHNLLSDPDPVLRTGAVRILATMAKPENIDALVTASKDSDQEVRRAAISGLGLLKDARTIPPLLEALKDSYWFVRSEAAEALGQTQSPLVVKGLLDASNDSDTTVQASVENALLHLAQAPGVSSDEFVSHLNDPNPKIVLTATLCLSLRKDPRATPILLKLIGSSDPTVRLTAVKGLGETGDISVAPTLRQTLRDPDLNMRGWSIIGLGKLKDAEALPELKVIANDPMQSDRIRSAADAAVANINQAMASRSAGATSPAPPSN